MAASHRKTRGRGRRGISFLALLATLVLSLSSFFALSTKAYETRLTTQAIREAYFLGASSGKRTADFLRQYERVFHGGEPGLYVQKVQIVTPYSQVVLAAQHDMINQNAVDAVQQFVGRSLPVLVRVSIDLPIGYVGTQGYELASRASVLVSQAHPLHPRKTSRQPIYVTTSLGKASTRSLIGVEVEQQFDTAEVSSADLKIRVTFQDGGHFETSFDLAHMK